MPASRRAAAVSEFLDKPMLFSPSSIRTTTPLPGAKAQWLSLDATGSPISLPKRLQKAVYEREMW